MRIHTNSYNTPKIASTAKYNFQFVRYLSLYLVLHHLSTHNLKLRNLFQFFPYVSIEDNHVFFFFFFFFTNQEDVQEHNRTFVKHHHCKSNPKYHNILFKLFCKTKDASAELKKKKTCLKPIPTPLCRTTVCVLLLTSLPVHRSKCFLQMYNFFFFLC